MRDLIVSTNDAKYRRVDGRDTYPEGAGADTLDLIDASAYPPRIVASVGISTTIAGPPQAVALSPDGRYAVVSAPNRYDRERGASVFENYLQLVDLQGTPPRVVDKAATSHHPQGVAFHPQANLLAAATAGGTVESFAIEEGRLIRKHELTVSKGRLAGIAFTPDGKAALAALRDEQGVAVLEFAGGRLQATPERVSAGVAPYAIDVCASGWAVVGNVGLAGLPGQAAQLAGDADTLTLIDLNQRPFRAVQHLSVPSLPEGVAISPDGRWIAALCMDGSNLAPGNPARREQGRVALFALRDGRAHPAGELPAGAGGQGIVFTADSRHLLAQFNVDSMLAVYTVADGALADTGHRIPTTGGPVSIRAVPGRRS
ncbi:YncE family protein [Caenimonas aquaedulcis]|uniref:YncE family protein n=1 Tax=Caenimonas aquaedulcis TaxID=2793270 RepID=A0A931H7T2_9BURK|nr:YncE family protein [Caenimonas aquaedulcis]MBG9390280.1 YncE family protein [Caenimonas aquaedulcis]